MIPLAAIAALAPMLSKFTGGGGGGDKKDQPGALERANMMSMPQGVGQAAPQQGPQAPQGAPMGAAGMGTYQAPAMGAGTGYQAPGMNAQGAMTMSAQPFGGQGMNNTGAQFTTQGVGGGMTSLF